MGGDFRGADKESGGKQTIAEIEKNAVPTEPIVVEKRTPGNSGRLPRRVWSDFASRLDIEMMPNLAQSWRQLLTPPAYKASTSAALTSTKTSQPLICPKACHLMFSRIWPERRSSIDR